MKRLAFLLLASCGATPLSDAKASLVEAKSILEQAIARLDQVDIDKDGKLSQAEIVTAIAIAWMEWQAHTTR